MSHQPDIEIEIRCRLRGKTAQELRELQDLGNFPSLKATAEYLIGCFAGSMVRGLQQAQAVVEQSPSQFLQTEEYGVIHYRKPDALSPRL